MKYVRINVVGSRGTRGERVSLRAGLTTCEGVLEAQGADSKLHITQRDAIRSGLKSGLSISYWNEEGALRLGPYIGIMTNKRKGAATGFAGLRGRRENYVALLQIARSMGAVGFVFACEDIDFQRGRIKGYQRDSAGKWVAREYPLPNVVYNRVPDRVSEVSPLVWSVKKRFNELGREHKCALFNPGFLNKWDLYRMLVKNPALEAYLPDTKVCRTADDILSMLKKHRMVYLKPRDSFAGHGIMRAEYTGGKYVLSFKQGGIYRHEPHGEFSGLVRSFSARRNSGAYLVQQGLRLAKYRGAIFDARIIAQKTGKGVWDLTGMGVRVAAKGGITTHVPNGGYIASIDRIVGEVFDQKLDSKNGVYARVRDLALNIAAEIERASKRMFGELSMDIGITADGDCFFFEANAKPMKFDEPVIRRKSLQTLVEYSRYLAGYHAQEDETWK